MYLQKCNDLCNQGFRFVCFVNQIFCQLTTRNLLDLRVPLKKMLMDC